jgi:hypothetical protein
MIRRSDQVGSHGPQDWRQLRLVKTAEDAMAGRRIGHVDHRPSAHGNRVTAMLPHDAIIILMRAEILLSHRGMKNRGEEFACAIVTGCDPWLRSNTQNKYLFQAKPAVKVGGYGEIKR